MNVRSKDALLHMLYYPVSDSTKLPDSEITVARKNFMKTLKFLGKNYLVDKR